MKNLILALVFVLLMVGAALAVTKTRGANVGVVGVPAAAGAVDKKDCQSACTMKKEKAAGMCDKSAGAKKTCPSGKSL